MTDIEHQSEKEKLSSLHGKAKAEYILTYYRSYFIFAVLAVIAVVIIVDAVQNAKKESKFGIAVLDAKEYDYSEPDSFQERLGVELGFNKYEYATSTFLNYPTDNSTLTEDMIASQEKLVTMVAVQQIDMIVAPEPVNTLLSANADYFIDLSEYLPQDIFDELVKKDKIVTLTNQDGVTFPALIKLSDEELKTEIAASMDQPTIGIVANSLNKDNTVLMIRRFLGMEIPESESAEETTTGA